jgi:hypothetical protein
MKRDRFQSRMLLRVLSLSSVPSCTTPLRRTLSIPLLGRIIAEPESRGKEDAGQIGASLVQFGEALDHGISAERLGDGISGDISEYWEHLFDVETGYPKEEIQNEFEVVDLDLLIIDYVAIYPEFRGLRDR